MNIKIAPIKAPTGTQLSCKGWHQEAVMRMLMTNLDPEDILVADGTVMAEQRLPRVLTADPGTGVMRHTDAGYQYAIDIVNERGVDLPMINGK